jgi:hypothetical protein
MLAVEMTDIVAGDLLIPGGWYAHVVSITPWDEDEHFYMPTLLGMGFSPDEALELEAKIYQSRFTFGFLHGLKEHLRAQVKRYARKYPQLAQPYEGKLIMLGFDPERLQAYHIPLAGHGSILNKRKLDTGINQLFEVFRAEALTGS